MTLHGDVIGVMMMASPKLLLKERHVMFPTLKPGRDTRLTNTRRMKWINKNMSIVARVVVDTMFRGAGLAYRFTNIASRMEGKRYIEIQSSMSKYNLFAQKAGFHFCPPMKSNKYDVGIRFFRGMFVTDPSDTEGLVQEILAYPETSREKIIAEVRAFYRKHSMLENTGKALIVTDGVAFGDSRVARLPLRELIHQLQQMVLASPLYGVYENPDAGRELPEEIPLMWFDRQQTNEKMTIEKSNG
jgi:ABC-type ATPase with predicted acetyltransferase domain